MTDTSRHDRRGFLARIAVAGATVGLSPRWLDAAAPATVHQDDPDAWIRRQTGQHKQLFDMATHDNGVGLVHVRNWLTTYNQAYSVPDGDLSAVCTLYGGTIPLGFNDAMWAKYQFGRALNITDPKTNQPLARNWFNHPMEGDPFALGLFDSSMEALRARNVTFILCNNAWNFWTQRLAQNMSGMTAAAIKDELRANMLPGIDVVPAMVIAIGKAQEAGIAYMRLG